MLPRLGREHRHKYRVETVVSGILCVLSGLSSSWPILLSQHERNPQIRVGRVHVDEVDLRGDLPRRSLERPLRSASRRYDRQAQCPVVGRGGAGVRP